MVKPQFILPPGLSHQLADFSLSVYSRFVRNKQPPEWHSLHWKNLYFPNPLAPAGGVDKSAKHIKAWWALGAGFMEIGTVTPLPQKKNPGPTLKRDTKAQALWNHLGFPGEGVKEAVKKLKKINDFKPTPLFANIGKNRGTKNEEAERDYLSCISALSPYVDAFVINISSPNTKQLGELSHPQNLKKLLKAIKERLNSLETTKPFFIKWSPDMSDQEFLASLDIALESGAEGHVICNTTTQRETKNIFPDYGGVSGAPLAALSKERLKLTLKHIGAERKNQLIISVGGVFTPEDVFERLDIGAHLVQTYSALVFHGPFFLKKIYKTSKLKLTKEKIKKVIAKKEKLKNNHS